jgi:DNA-nicking Smr family endonuclease
LKLEVRFTETAPDEDELKPMSGNRLRQLKRGIITVDRQLDLHGLTRDEALTELPRFLRNAQHKGCVAVLVITGKGYNSPGEPVLQHAVTSWLRDAGREMVIEYAPAPREMGGSGAFIVFLRTMPKAADASS